MKPWPFLFACLFLAHWAIPVDAVPLRLDGRGNTKQTDLSPVPAHSVASAAQKTLGASSLDKGIPDDLPLVERPAPANTSETLAIIVTGDGGWAEIDQALAEECMRRGMSVVGFNSLKYFWKTKTPDQAATDLQRIIEHYLMSWRKDRLLLIGYSQGADVLPFMITRLTASLKTKINGVALLGLSHQASFVIQVSSWFGGERAGDHLYPIEPELHGLEGLKVLCIFGKEEADSLCRTAVHPVAGWTAVALAGGHHFGGDYQKLSERLFRELAIR